MRQTRITKTTPRRRKGETDKREREERRLALVPSLSFPCSFSFFSGCLSSVASKKTRRSLERENNVRGRETKPKLANQKSSSRKEKHKESGPLTVAKRQGSTASAFSPVLLLLLRVHTIKEDKTGRERGKERERMTKRVSLSLLLLQRRKSKRRLRSLSRRKGDTKMKKLLPPPLLSHPKS